MKLGKIEERVEPKTIHIPLKLSLTDYILIRQIMYVHRAVLPQEVKDLFAIKDDEMQEK